MPIVNKSTSFERFHFEPLYKERFGPVLSLTEYYEIRSVEPARREAEIMDLLDTHREKIEHSQ